MAQQRTRAVASATKNQSRRVGRRAADERREVASQAKEEGRQVASTVARRGQQVADETGRDAQDLVSKTKQQASMVVEEVSDQARDMVDHTKNTVQEQTASQTQRLADNLAQLGEEALALSEGRAEDAERARRLAAQAADKLFGVADRVSVVADDIDERGLEGLIDDVQRFARRRPGLFLLGAAVAGFGVGRLVRARDPEPGDELDANGSSGNGRAGTTGTSTRALTPASTRRAASAGGR